MKIKEIKQSLSIEKVLQHYNLKPNRNNMLNCPFHKDDKPSLKIYPKTNSFNCFGCDAGGDQIEFIQLKEKTDKHRAIIKAKEMLAVLDYSVGEALQKATKIINPNEKPSQAIQAQAEPTSKAEKTELLEKLFAYFRTAVYSSHPAKNYAQYNRGINVYETEIGYNSAQFHHGKRKDMELINQCVKYGVLTPTNVKTKTGAATGYIVYAKNCIIFPLKNKAGKITSFYGRSIIDNNNSKHFYLKDREGLYPSYPPAETTKLILTEAIIDAATLIQIPIITKEYEILSCYGTNGFTQEHKTAIKEWVNTGLPSGAKQRREVIIFFDGDKSGQEAAKRIAIELKKINTELTVSIVNTPENEDVNSLALAHEPEIFTQLIKESELFLLNETLPEEIKEPEIKSKPKPIISRLNTKNPEQLTFETTELKITIWGGIDKENLSRLKISLHIRSKTNKYRSFRDDVNLYSYSAVKKLIQNIAETLEISTTVVSNTITELTEKLEEYRLNERTAQLISLIPKLYEMTEKEKQTALEFLRQPNLVKRTLEMIRQSGLIGEQKNGLLLFFLYLSRLMDEPLHAIIFGKSGSGKTYLQTKISECLPEESVRTITSLTENTLYYSTKDYWKHKVLLIEDLEGVYNAFLPLREFMSKQSITKLTTDKDTKGNNVQKVLTVEGPVCVSGATTSGYIYEDNANRSYLLHIDESPVHLHEVMDFQRKLQAGLINEAKQELARQILKNSQRLLGKVKVINPFATELVIPDSVFKKLRTNMHYLKLIEIITFYNQYQRKLKKNQKGESFIETTLEDIEIANWLVKDTLLRKSDELSGDLRQFFESLKNLVRQVGNEQKNFFVRDIRKTLRMHPMKLSRYISNLEHRGYLKRIGGNRQTGYEYEVTVWEDYEILKDGINLLDRILEKIKAKNNGKTKLLSQPFTPLSQKQL